MREGLAELDWSRAAESVSEELLRSPASGPRKAGGSEVVLDPVCGGGGYASGVAAGNDFSPFGGIAQMPATSQPEGKRVCTIHLVESWQCDVVL